MQFLHEKTSAGLVVSIHGSFTFKDHPTFGAVLDLLAACGGTQQTIDLSQVDFLDSAALGMLLIADDEATKRQSVLTFRNPSAQIMRLFELSAMDSVFKITRTLA